NIRREMYASKRIILTVCDKTDINVENLPEDTVISGKPSIIEEVFLNDGSSVNWKSLNEWASQSPNTKEANLLVLREISRAVYCIAKGRPSPSLQGVIFVGPGPKRYRPVVCHVDALPRNQLEADLLLVEDVGGRLQNVDKHIGALFTAIRIAIRLRWEI